MKLVHLTDIHIHDRTIVNCEPVSRFKAALAHIAEHHQDADMVIITGDLTHDGASSSYRTLRELLDGRGFAANPHLILGNHDRRDNFRKVFDSAPIDSNGFVQYALDAPIGASKGDESKARFLFLDTNEPGTHSGRLCEKRLDWLKAELEVLRAAGRAPKSVFLAMHHQPVTIGVPNTDIIGLLDQKAFREILEKFSDMIRHIFFGHGHFIVSGHICGISFSAPRATSHPSVPHFSDARLSGYGDTEPTYDLCLIDSQTLVIHPIEFLAHERTQWLGPDADR